MNQTYHCPSLCDHQLTRRAVLGSLAGATAGMNFSHLLKPAVAETMNKKEKQVLLIWLDGGMSQLESWDPKPNTQFGGPYRSIPTKLPGVHFSELMPHLAQRANQLSIVRSMKTEDANHSSGVPKILRGQPKNRGVIYPYFGSAVAKLLGPTQSGLPPYLWVKPGNGGFISKHAGFLGAKYGALAIGDGKPPDNLIPPEFITESVHQSRNDLRTKLNQRYASHHRQQASEANGYVFHLAETLMKQAHLFDESKLSMKDKERYGTSDFGRLLLLSRRLLEAEARFIQMTSYGWDTHGDNFNAHASRVPKIDQGISALLDDLKERGMLDHVLVVIMAEFGRTPRINGSLGRDHWPNAWSLAMTGTGIKQGVVIGETNEQGTDVKTKPYDIGFLFHTWFQAIGLDSTKLEYHNNEQPLPIAHDDYEPIRELLV